MDLGTFKIRDENPVSSINTKQDYINGNKRMKFDSIKNRYNRMTER